MSVIARFPGLVKHKQAKCNSAAKEAIVFPFFNRSFHLYPNNTIRKTKNIRSLTQQKSKTPPIPTPICNPPNPISIAPPERQQNHKSRLILKINPRFLDSHHRYYSKPVKNTPNQCQPVQFQTHSNLKLYQLILKPNSNHQPQPQPQSPTNSPSASPSPLPSPRHHLSKSTHCLSLKPKHPKTHPQRIHQNQQNHQYQQNHQKTNKQKLCLSNNVPKTKIINQWNLFKCFEVYRIQKRGGVGTDGAVHGGVDGADGGIKEDL